MQQKQLPPLSSPFPDNTQHHHHGGAMFALQRHGFDEPTQSNAQAVSEHFLRWPPLNRRH